MDKVFMNSTLVSGCYNRLHSLVTRFLRQFLVEKRNQLNPNNQDLKSLENLAPTRPTQAVDWPNLCPSLRPILCPRLTECDSFLVSRAAVCFDEACTRFLRICRCVLFIGVFGAIFPELRLYYHTSCEIKIIITPVPVLLAQNVRKTLK